MKLGRHREKEREREKQRKGKRRVTGHAHWLHGERVYDGERCIVCARMCMCMCVERVTGTEDVTLLG